MGIYCSFDPKITFRVDSETSYLPAFLKSVTMFYRALVILSYKRKQNFSKFCDIKRLPSISDGLK